MNNELKAQIEKDAEEYGESFKTGEWFETLRIEAHKAGAISQNNKVMWYELEYGGWIMIEISKLSSLKITDK